MGLAISLILNSCAKSAEEAGTTSGDKLTLPVTVSALVEHAEYCENIYDNGGTEIDNLAYEVKTDDGITIIVIRGTDNTDNVLSDIDIRMIKDDVLDIYLHKGFKDASTTIIQEVDKYYQLEHTVHVTGHSLGGAIAQIIGMWLHKRGHNVQVFSYGSPKVSSQVLVSGQPTHWRVVRLSDPVTFSPTYPYVHTGVFVNSQTLDWGPDNDNGLISQTDGLDHSISKYVTTLKEQL
jgi:predicted lipase